jgi:glyoxylase-like metal-dependent hydrolase (beta-lactamase superfamily II)
MSDAKVREVWPGVHVIQLPLPMRPSIVNVYLLHSRDQWALVDTGVNSPESLTTLDAALKQAGCAFERLNTVICTHFHLDHCGASQPVKDRSGAAVYMNGRDYENAEALLHQRHRKEGIALLVRSGVPLDRFVHASSTSESGMYAPAVPDHFIEDGQVLSIGDFEVEVIHTPGHTPGHCVLFLRSQRLLIAGDHLLPKITPHVGLYTAGLANPLRDFLDSQRKIEPYDVNMVLPAHGGTFLDHRHRIKQIIQHHEYRLQEMVDVIRPQARTAYEIASLVFSFDADTALMVQLPATFETLAHLEYLHSLGRIVREERNERTFYRAA